MKIFKLFIIFLVLSFCSTTYAARHYGCTSLTGGAAGSLDALDITAASTPNPNDLVDGDSAMVTTINGSTTTVYFYIFDADGTDVESSPFVIRPDDFATAGVWRNSKITTPAIDHTTLTNIGTNTHAQIDTHISDTANPHSTDIGNLGTGTLAELNTKVTDATLDDSSSSRPPSGTAGGDLGGTYPNPTVNDGADSTAIHDNTAGEINAITEKVTPVSGDWLLIEDSAAANAKKKVQVGNLPGGGSIEGTDVLSTGETGGIKFLREDGDGTSSWQVPAGSSPLTTKGDLYGYSTTNARIPVGADGNFLVVDSAEGLGVKWAFITTSDLPTTGTWNASGIDITLGPLTNQLLIDDMAADNWKIFTISGTGASTVANFNTDVINDTHIDWGTGANQVSIVDVPATAWRMFYSNGSGVITEVDLGTSGQVWKSNGSTAAPTWQEDSTGSGSLGTNLSSTTDDITSDNGTIRLDSTGGTNNEDLDIDLETTANTVVISSTTGVTNINTGAISVHSTGTLKGRLEYGADITASTNHDTTECHNTAYHFTAAATVTLDAAADAGYGSVVSYRVRDAAEAAVIDVQGTEKINLDGTALAAGTAITATGAGSFVTLVATTDTDGSGTDGWEVWGNNGFVSE